MYACNKIITYILYFLSTFYILALYYFRLITRLTNVEIGPILIGSNCVSNFLDGGWPEPEELLASLADRLVAIFTT